MTIETMTATTLRPADQPTLYFIGVTTGQSSIQRVFPLWAEAIGLDRARLQGVDLPLHAPAADYRAVVEHVARDPLSLGALVTTHKLDLFRACVDLFDEIDPFARMMGETSCISKRDGRLVCHAKDPISSGLAIDAFLPAGYWTDAGAETLCIGAGGSAIAISWHLSRPAADADRPKRIVVADRSPQRLEHIRAVHAGLDTTVAFEHVLVPTLADNDAVLRRLSEGALVVNATGLGKDVPGSPISDHAVFPDRATAWDLNYRGDLRFLDQARLQSAERALRVEDGWIYFVHGWTQVIAEVFHVGIPTEGPAFDRLSELALGTRR